MLVVYIFLAVGVSFICSLLESVLLSITPSYILAAENQKKRYAKDLRKYASDKDLSISAILTLNTFAHTLGAAGVGSEAFKILSTMNFSDGRIEFYLSGVSFVLTLVILYISEIIPKSLGHRYWKGLTPVALKFFPVMIFILYPILTISSLLMKVFKSKSDSTGMSREEVESMIELGVRGNALVKDEGKLLKHTLIGSRKTIEDVMTPARKLYMAEVDNTYKDLYDMHMPISRIPIYRNSVNEVLGYVQNSDIKDSIIKGNGETKISEDSDLLRPINIENRHTPLRIMFNKFIKDKEHISMVCDDYGTVLGVVTLEDIVETFFGVEIMDETDETEDLQDAAKAEFMNEEKKKDRKK
jgi:CBS domain containing-hemolysin-like protein